MKNPTRTLRTAVLVVVTIIISLLFSSSPSEAIRYYVEPEDIACRAEGPFPNTTVKAVIGYGAWDSERGNLKCKDLVYEFKYSSSGGTKTEQFSGIDTCDGEGKPTCDYEEVEVIQLKDLEDANELLETNCINRHGGSFYDVQGDCLHLVHDN